MKISNDHIISELPPAGSSNQSNSTGKSEFADLLAEMVEEKVTASRQGFASEETRAVSQASETELPELWFKVNGLLDTLDAYGKALGDPNQTLKQMEPLVLSLEQQAENLEAQFPPLENGSLNELAAQAVMSAKVESMKYWRGDYIS